FSFSATSIFQKIQSNFPVFHDLLSQAGLANQFELRYTFLSDNEEYTVLVPNDSVLTAFQADTLEQEELRELLRLHFVQGDLIFTDGQKSAGYYKTARIDEKSTNFTTIFSKIYIDPGVDVINIADAQGGTYTGAVESEFTNIMTGMDVGEGTEVFRDLIITGVVHEIDRVLLFEEVDTD
ncbi:MAG: fasciclin domain-containing protein, partial [Bacteroidales bacterium]|nr:fasciclin domain-containing protein [Bacteroidales bacterium]